MRLIFTLVLCLLCTQAFSAPEFQVHSDHVDLDQVASRHRNSYQDINFQTPLNALSADFDQVAQYHIQHAQAVNDALDQIQLTMAKQDVQQGLDQATQRHAEMVKDRPEGFDFVRDIWEGSSLKRTFFSFSLRILVWVGERRTVQSACSL